MSENSNYNHFTGKKGKAGSKRRKKERIKKVHKNAYATYSHACQERKGPIPFLTPQPITCPDTLLIKAIDKLNEAVDRPFWMSLAPETKDLLLHNESYIAFLRENIQLSIKALLDDAALMNAVEECTEVYLTTMYKKEGQNNETR